MCVSLVSRTQLLTRAVLTASRLLSNPLVFLYAAAPKAIRELKQRAAHVARQTARRTGRTQAPRRRAHACAPAGRLNAIRAPEVRRRGLAHSLPRNPPLPARLPAESRAAAADRAPPLLLQAPRPQARRSP